MIKIILSVTLILITNPVIAQILYLDVCKVPCKVCKPDPMKIEYKADASGMRKPSCKLNGGK
jgi:hypothetical protein